MRVSWVMTLCEKVSSDVTMSTHLGSRFRDGWIPQGLIRQSLQQVVGALAVVKYTTADLTNLGYAERLLC